MHFREHVEACGEIDVLNHVLIEDIIERAVLKRKLMGRIQSEY
jgi:hypothetical protein